jgi:hypothetical protein
MDLGRPKNKSSWNKKKLVSLCPAHCVDSDHIIVFANGCRMRKISRSDRFPKQKKSQLVKGHMKPPGDNTWQWHMMTSGSGRCWHMADHGQDT